MKDKKLFLLTTLALILGLMLVLFYWYIGDYVPMVIMIMGIGVSFPFYIYGILNDNEWY